MKLSARIGVMAAIGIVGATLPAAAQEYPTKLITMIIPFQPGSVDVIGRPLFARVEKKLGQPIIFDYKGGAGGAIGAKYVVDAKPDGYTLLYTAPAPITRQALNKTPYDSTKDLTAICGVVESTIFLVANPKFPAKTLDALLTAARQRPGKTTMGSNGTGTPLHIMGAQLQMLAGVKMLHVPYKSNAPMVLGLVTGQIDAGVSPAGTVSAFIKEGRLTPLVAFNAKRDAAFPDVPAITEALPSYELISTGTALFGPAGLPREIVKRMETETLAAARDPELVKLMVASGQHPIDMSSAELSASIPKSIQLIRSIADQIGIERN